MNKIAALLLVVGSTLVSLIGADQFFTKYIPASRLVFDFITPVGVALIILSSVIYAIYYLSTPTSEHYYCESIDKNEFDEVYNLMVDTLGHLIVSRAQLKEIIRANSDSVQTVKKTTSRGLRQKSSIEGYFAIIPLTKPAAQLMRLHVLTGSKLLPEHVEPQITNSDTLYIGGVGGRDREAKAHTFNQMIGYLSSCARANQIKYFISTPTTKRGFALAKAHRFFPIPSDDREVEVKNYMREILRANSESR